jgi:Helix-turn-helix domain
VLVGLANLVGLDGTGAFPSVATLVRYTGLSERTVRTCLDRLEAAVIISLGDADIVAARIKRADRRPQGWDLNLSQARTDVDEVEPAGQTSARQALLAGRLRRVHDDHLHGVHALHPQPCLWITSPAGWRGRTPQLVSTASSTPASWRASPAALSGR